MNEEQKKNVIIILLVLIVIALTTLIVLLLTNTINVNIDNNDNDGVEIGDNLTSDVDALNKITGSWGKCNGLSCYFLTIQKEDEEYFYKAGQYWSDGGLIGNIIEQKAISNDELYLKVHFPKRVTEMSETIEQTNEYIVDISKLNSNIIVVSNTEYEKITGSFDEFFNARVSE